MNKEWVSYEIIHLPSLDHTPPSSSPQQTNACSTAASLRVTLALCWIPCEDTPDVTVVRQL